MPRPDARGRAVSTSAAIIDRTGRSRTEPCARCGGVARFRVAVQAIAAFGPVRVRRYCRACFVIVEDALDRIDGGGYV
jgi:hypothetical protein